ncbi:MAG: hypothetical protein IT438_02905 [Phycisphaerales bacterium]|nr:hypothetical protein [Phycisphaerales bacterium]
MTTSTVQSSDAPTTGGDAPPSAGRDGSALAAPPGPARPVTGRPPARKRTLVERIEAYISKLSTKNNFWHRVCSLIWLPFAFRSGIKMKRVDPQTFTAVLPFRRFNRNWYNAMAGAALLGNSEIAGGMYVFGIAGGDYTVVCKNLSYTFLRPCLGPAVYRIRPRENIQELLGHGGEFNITIDLDIYQGITKIAPGKTGEREKRVGRCEATFHVTPKAHHKHKRERRAGAAEAGAAEPDQPPPT